MRKIGIATALVVGLILGRAASAEEVHLIMTTISLPGTPASQMFHEWADRVNAEGKGLVNIDVRDGFTLANSKNFYDRILDDVVQVSFGSLNYLVGKFPLCQVMGLPFVFDSAEQASAVFWQLYQSHTLDSEFDQVVPLFVEAFPQNSLHLTKAPAAPLVDLRGLRLIASGRIETRVIQDLGGTPLSISLSDSYQALERGTADGLIFPMAPLPDFKLDEVTHYHVVASLGGGPGGAWMAKAKYLALPPEVRSILEKNSGETQSRRAGRVLDELQLEVPKRLLAMNQVVIPLTPTQAEHWKTAVSPVLDNWSDTDSAQAAAVLAKVRALAAAFQSGR